MIEQKHIPPTGVRMPPEMKEFFKEEAKQHDRSFNSEIVNILKQVMEERKRSEQH